MSVKFFGQFLIDQGEVDASHVREALVLMERENPTLGELATARDYMTRRDAARVSAEQRRRDVPFGDLAVEMGLLTSAQRVDLVRHQRARRLPIGQALVRLGHVGTDRLGTLLDAYKADQAQYAAGGLVLPAPLANQGAAAYVIELLPKFLRRVARIQAKVGEISPLAGQPDFAELKVAIALEGVQALAVVLVADASFAEGLAIAASGLTPGDLDPEMVADGVGEFLNVLCGNAVGAATRQGHRFELGPPDYEAEVADGWCVDLAVGVGRAQLVLSLF